MMTTARYKNGNDDKSDNNEDKVYLFFKNDVDGSRIRSRPRSYNPGSCNHGVTIVFLFGVSFDKQMIVKSYLELAKKLLNLIGETREKPVLLSIQRTS